MKNQARVYEAADADRVISQYARKPSEAVRERIKASLSREQDRFVVMDRFHPREQQRLHGRSGDRGR